MKDLVEDINGGGFVCGIVVWLVIVYLIAEEAACLKSKSCGSDDLMMYAFIGVGMLIPALIAAALSSILFKKYK